MTNLRLVATFVLLVLCHSSVKLFAQMHFDKVEVRTSYGKAKEGTKGKFLIDHEFIRFVGKNGRDEYFSIPSNAVTELFYSRVSGRRIKTAIALSPLLLFSKGKKHFMTISFNDGEKTVGAAEFKLDKRNYRGILRAIEQVSDVQLEFDQEGIKDEKETVAARDYSDSHMTSATLEISSTPDDAEIQIDGILVGMSPSTEKISAGEHKIKVLKKGYAPWERTVKVEAGERLEIKAELERN